jgi:hypothetical protein
MRLWTCGKPVDWRVADGFVGAGIDQPAKSPQSLGIRSVRHRCPRINIGGNMRERLG